MAACQRILRTERGATTLELTLVFIPFLIFWLIGFDFGMTLVEMISFRKAHYAAGRLGAVQRTNCRGVAGEELQRRLGGFGVVSSYTVYGQGEPVNGLRGLNLVVAIPATCVTCMLFPGLRAISTYQSGTFYPYEDQNACLEEDV